MDGLDGNFRTNGRSAKASPTFLKNLIYIYIFYLIRLTSFLPAVRMDFVVHQEPSKPSIGRKLVDVKSIDRAALLRRVDEVMLSRDGRWYEDVGSPLETREVLHVEDSSPSAESTVEGSDVEESDVGPRRGNSCGVESTPPVGPSEVRPDRLAASSRGRFRRGGRRSKSIGEVHRDRIRRRRSDIDGVRRRRGRRRQAGSPAAEEPLEAVEESPIDSPEGGEGGLDGGPSESPEGLAFRRRRFG